MVCWHGLLVQLGCILAAAGTGFEEEAASLKESAGRTLLTKREFQELDKASQHFARRLGDAKPDKAFCPKYSKTEIKERGPMLAKVGILRGTNLPNFKGSWGSTDVPDGFVHINLTIGNVKEVAQTKTISDKTEPEWDFKCEFPVPEADGGFNLSAEVFNFNRNRPHEKIGDFHRTVKYNEPPFTDKMEIMNCKPDVCKSKAYVYIQVKWTNDSSNVEPDVQPPSPTDDGGGSSFPVPLIIIGIVLLLLCGAAIAGFAVMNKSDLQEPPSGPMAQQEMMRQQPPFSQQGGYQQQQLQVPGSGYQGAGSQGMQQYGGANNFGTGSQSLQPPGSQGGPQYGTRLSMPPPPPSSGEYA